MQPTMAVVAPVLLGIAALVVVRHLLVRLLWGPITQPDDNQEKCRAGGNRVPSDGHSPSGIVRVIRLTDDGEFADRCELTDVLYEIRNPKKSELVVRYIHGWKHNAGDRDADLRAFRIMIGHSFGARILYTATCQVLLDEVQRRHPGRRKASYAEIKAPVDLIMLLNPAFEASMFTAMHAIRPTQWSEAIGLEQKRLQDPAVISAIPSGRSSFLSP